MPVALPRFRVGDALRHEALSVFPLFSEPGGGPDYRLSDEALSDGTVVVQEVSEGGSVPELVVENTGDVRVLFLEGEELVGAKQNRILNTSVLIAAHSKIKVPVSCVEHSRWSYTSRHFRASGSHSPSKLRRTLKESVTRSVRENRGHTSDQRAVWREVATLHETHRVASHTQAMSDAFEAYKDRIAAYKERLTYVEGATGMAVAVGDRIVSADVFDKPATCRKVWERLLSGFVFDALEAKPSDRAVSTADVEEFLAVARGLPWEPAETVGEGEEYRAESGRGDCASALVLAGAMVHGSVLSPG